MTRMSVFVCIAASVMAACGIKTRVSEEPGSADDASRPVQEEAAEKHEPDRVEVLFFLMSQCPYAAQVVVALDEAVSILGEHVVYEPYFIWGTKDGEPACLHGPEECELNLVHLCAGEIRPEVEIPMSACIFEDFAHGLTIWPDCAESLGLDVEAIESCVEGPQGEDLRQKSIDVALEYEARGSPTIFIGGEEYRGDREPESLVAAICLAMPGEKRPDPCPDFEPASLTVISDERCQECDERAGLLQQQFEDMFLVLETTWLDWSDKEAKDLMADLDIEFLPAYVFDAHAADLPAFEMIENHVSLVAGHYVVDAERVHSTHDPDREICTNFIDDTGDGLVDCDDPDCADHDACMEQCDNGVDDTDDGLVDCDDPHCAQTLDCREDDPGKLALWIMSRCPYGSDAVEVVSAVLETLGEDVDFTLYFILDVLDDDAHSAYPRKSWCERYENDLWYCSMHGPGEVEEDIWMACAQQANPGRFPAFLDCWTQEPDGDWQTCAHEAGIGKKKILKCIEGGRGLEILAEHAALGEATGITASPTWLFNDKYPEKGGADLTTILDVFCSHNAGHPACDGSPGAAATSHSTPES